MSPRTRWYLGVGAALVIGVAAVLVARRIEPELVPAQSAPPALPPAQSGVLAGKAALEAVHGSIGETLAAARERIKQRQPVMAVSVLAHVELWRQHIGAGGLPTEQTTAMLQDLAVVQQRSSLGYPDGSLTPNDQAIILERLEKLEKATADALATAQ